MKSSALVVIVLYLLVLHVPSNAQNVVSVADTSLTRGFHSLVLTVRGDLKVNDTVNVRLRFDLRSMDVRGVRGKDSAVAVTSWSLQSADKGMSECAVAFLVAKTPSGGAADLVMDVDILAGPDTVTIAEPKECTRNSAAFTSVYKAGTIRLLDAPVSVSESEYLGPAFPSASPSPAFSFSLAMPGTVVFSVFDIAGRVMSEETSTVTFKGIHLYRPQSESFVQLCDGPYVMQMKTSIGLYSTPFILMH